MDVTRRAETCPTIRLSQKHTKFSSRGVRVHDGTLVQSPIETGSITRIVGRVHGNASEVRESVLHNNQGEGRIEVYGDERTTALSQTGSGLHESRL